MNLTPADAKARRQVELDDGQIGYLLFVPVKTRPGQEHGKRRGRAGGRIRVALESGAVVSCDPDRVRPSRTTSSASKQDDGGET
jgi:hypothetical protein